MSEKMDVLKMIESGEISAEEGARRLQALTWPVQPPRASASPRWVRRVWLAVFLSGTVLAAGGGLLIAGSHAWETGVASAICGWLMLVFGLLGLLLGIWLQRTPWFSLRVENEGRRRISLALPLPLGPVAWIVRLIRPFVPQLQDMAVDEVILALREELREGHPFVVAVNEGKGREQVHVYFG
jgi:hypothetical protein